MIKNVFSGKMVRYNVCISSSDAKLKRKKTNVNTTIRYFFWNNNFLMRNTGYRRLFS